MSDDEIKHLLAERDEALGLYYLERERRWAAEKKIEAFVAALTALTKEAAELLRAAAGGTDNG